MKKIAILVDSSADISNEEAKAIGVHVIRMPLTIGNETKMECDEISAEEFIEAMNNGIRVTTSQPILGDLIRKWEELLKEYDQVLYIPISEGLSGTYSSAVTASADFAGQVYVTRSVLVSYPLQYIAQEAVKMANMGADIEDIKKMVELDHCVFAVIIPETLTHLKNGGRISATVAALGNLLKIVPLLKYENGTIDALDRVRTMKKAVFKAKEYVENVSNKEEYNWYIVHSDSLESANEYRDLFQESMSVKIEVKELRACITAHTGPGTICFGRIKKIKH